jgi:hypothetical protein
MRIVTREELSDEAIHDAANSLDYRAALAMTDVADLTLDAINCRKS